MTNAEFITKLEVIADMSDQQLACLANLLIDYLRADKKPLGFKQEKK